MRVVVLGGGISGMASSARLAKLGHQVTLLEAAPALGGALAPIGLSLPEGTVTWDAGAHHTMLPAVIRDLFRKSGRPLEKELDIEPLAFVREHRFADGSTLRLPGGSRAAQVRAGNELGPGLGQAWAAHVDPYGRDWELLRRDFFERVWRPELASVDLRDLLASRESLAKRVRALPDARLQAAATWSVVLAGQDPRRVPAWLGLSVYLEQNFGSWRVPGGMHRLGAALAQRLSTRKVTVHTSTPALDLVVGTTAGTERVTGVRTATEVVPADAVVVAMDPRTLPSLARHLKPRGSAEQHSTLPPDQVHLVLDEAHLPGGPDVLGPEGHEIVFHPPRPLGTDPVVAVRTGGSAPAGLRAWTLLVAQPDGRDPLATLADRGLDLRPAVRARLDRSGAEQRTQWGGSPNGPRWTRPRDLARRWAVRTPIEGTLLAGAASATGPGLPFAGLSGALVAETLGKAT